MSRPSYEELVEALWMMVLQHSSTLEDGVDCLDTGALSANADAVRILERLGLAEIDRDHSFGRVVNGQLLDLDNYKPEDARE